MASTAEQAIIARRYLTFLIVKKTAIEQALNSLSTVSDRAMLLGQQQVCHSSINSMVAIDAARDYLLSESKHAQFRDVANVAAGMIVLDYAYGHLVELAGGSGRAYERITEHWVSKMIDVLKEKIEVCVGLRGVYGE